MDYVTFPFEKFVSCITTEYDVQADSVLALYIEIAKYLRDNPIVSGLTVKEIIEKYLEENPPSAGVVSVNGRTGAVTGLYDAQNPPPYPVRSVNGKTGVVTGLYDAQNPPPYPVESVNGKTGVVTGLYSAENPPPYPVTSVNGKTGEVTGLYSTENPPPYPVTSVNGLTGATRGIRQGGALTAGMQITPGTQSFYLANMFPDSTLPVGNTAGFNLNFTGVINDLVPCFACFASNEGYGAQVSLCRTSTGLRVVITNHGVESAITLGPLFVCFNATSGFTYTGVSSE